MKDIVLIDGARTPFGTFGGAGFAVDRVRIDAVAEVNSGQLDPVSRVVREYVI
jgi:acetyl-CoA acetyltransferase